MNLRAPPALYFTKNRFPGPQKKHPRRETLSVPAWVFLLSVLFSFSFRSFDLFLHRFPRLHFADSLQAAAHHGVNCSGRKERHVRSHNYISELSEIEQVPVGKDVGSVIAVNDTALPLDCVQCKSADFAALNSAYEASVSASSPLAQFTRTMPSRIISMVLSLIICFVSGRRGMCSVITWDSL